MHAHDPFCLTPGAPHVVDEEAEREDRVARVQRFVDDVLGGRQPSREDEVFLASAFDAWLRSGGHLSRQCLRLHGPRGPHDKSPQAIARRLRDASSQ